MKLIKSIFQSGVKIVAPFLLTLFILYWVFIGLESFLQWLLLLFIDESMYFKGLGWISLIIFIFFVGLITRIKFIRRLQVQLQGYLLQLPLIKTFYNTASDLTHLFTKKGIKEGEVVLLKTPIGKVLGIVTQEDLSSLPEGAGGKDEIAVYVQMSYNVGGYTLIVERDSVEPLKISPREGMALSMTAWVSGKRGK